MKILLGVTGSVAAIRTPELYQAIRQTAHEVKIVATQAALYFFDPAGIDQTPEASGGSVGERGVLTPRLSQLPGGSHPPLAIPQRNPEVVILDEDEWPGRDAGRRYERDDPVLHIELRRWAELLLIAPLDANTLAKLAAGLADNCLTCVWRAWDPNRPVILAPAMNTLMWEHPLTGQHLLQLAASFQAPQTVNDLPRFAAGQFEAQTAMEGEAPAEPRTPEKVDRLQPSPPEPSSDQLLEDYLIDWINQNCPKLRIVPPVSRRLACGDVGMGAMASVPEIVNAVADLAKLQASK